ncbi:hypothetical protein [Sphingomonas sp. MMS24-J13]|uniref:hypothetical protein n=1 Tax=Sphingomonas sp. MMS24-J13 TaxID=3238686 RepID=UPI00384B8BD1
MAERCDTCRFWDPYARNDGRIVIGDCRRRAPVINVELLRRALPGPSCDQFEDIEANIYVASAWPVTAAESCCGEYETNNPEWN